MTSDHVVPLAVARAMIRSLTRGTTVADGARYIHVGHENWLLAQRELLEELAEDGGSETKFIRGAYGSGKSHFLAVVQDQGRDLGWVTSHVECKVNDVQIDRFETLYPKITANLRFSGLANDEEESYTKRGMVDAVRALLDKWSGSLLIKAGLREGKVVSRPFDIDARVFGRLRDEVLSSNIPSDFTKAVSAYVRARLSADFETIDGIVSWIKGDGQTALIPTHYLQRPTPSLQQRSREHTALRPIGTGTAQEAMRGLLWLIHSAGHSGLILCIDEIEELAKLRPRRRQDQALQALREHVDHAGGDSGYARLCLYLAATPEMFENADYFPRYDALATRIQPVSEEINWRAPVVDLDRTPLDRKQLKEMATKIQQVHTAAYHGDSSSGLSSSLFDTFVDEVLQSRVRLAKPRLLARVIVDELERARQVGSNYQPPKDLSGIVQRAAQKASVEA